MFVRIHPHAHPFLSSALRLPPDPFLPRLPPSEAGQHCLEVPQMVHWSCTLFCLSEKVCFALTLYRLLSRQMLPFLPRGCLERQGLSWGVGGAARGGGGLRGEAGLQRGLQQKEAKRCRVESSERCRCGAVWGTVVRTENWSHTGGLSKEIQEG